MGLRRRLDRLEGQATSTMSDARLLIEAAKELLDEIGDGVDITLVQQKDGPSLLDFISGKTDEFPISIRVKINE